MNPQRATMTALLSMALTWLFSFGHPLLAQGTCVQAKATFVDVCVAGTPNCTGTITQGGILNGTTVTAFTGGPLPTPDPATFSFSNDLTVTTVQGQLQLKNVILFNAATTVTSAIGSIDPNASTGRFAGASGVLFNRGKTVSFEPFTVQLEISGEICFAN